MGVTVGRFVGSGVGLGISVGRLVAVGATLVAVGFSVGSGALVGDGVGAVATTISVGRAVGTAATAGLRWLGPFTREIGIEQATQITIRPTQATIALPRRVSCRPICRNHQ